MCAGPELTELPARPYKALPLGPEGRSPGTATSEGRTLCGPDWDPSLLGESKCISGKRAWGVGPCLPRRPRGQTQTSGSAAGSRLPSWTAAALDATSLGAHSCCSRELPGSLVSPSFTRPTWGRGLAFCLTIATSSTSSKSTSIQWCSLSKIFGAALLKKESDLSSIIIQLCIVRVIT